MFTMAGISIFVQKLCSILSFEYFINYHLQKVNDFCWPVESSFTYSNLRKAW